MAMTAEALKGEFQMLSTFIARLAGNGQSTEDLIVRQGDSLLAKIDRLTELSIKDAQVISGVIPSVPWTAPQRDDMNARIVTRLSPCSKGGPSSKPTRKLQTCANFEGYL